VWFPWVINHPIRTETIYPLPLMKTGIPTPASIGALEPVLLIAPAANATVTTVPGRMPEDDDSGTANGQTVKSTTYRTALHRVPEILCNLAG
jgi:hypothetical protein